MAFPTVQAVGAYGLSGGNYTVTLPGGIAADDIILLLIETDDQTPGTPSGYAEIPSSRASRGGGTRLTWFWKRATASESNPVVGDAGDHTGGFAFVLRGCFIPGDPWNVVGSPRDGLSSGAGTAVTLPALTTTKLDCLVLMGCAGGNDTAAAQFSAQANGTLANFTTHKNEGNAGGNGGGIILCTGELATPGSSGNFTATHSGDNNWAGVQIAFRPPEPFTPQAIWQR